MILKNGSILSKQIRSCYLHYSISLAAIALLLGLLVPAAIAEVIPLPRSAPKARDAEHGAPPDIRSVIPAPLSTAATTPPTPMIPDPHNRAPSNIFITFDTHQRSQVAKISTYLSSLQNLTGNFVQIGPDGSRSTGSFYIRKPGKIRFQYDPPSPIAIIADGSSVVVRDQKLATQDLYPLSQTPLRFLLSDKIDLMKDTNVVSVTSDDMFVGVTIEENQPLVGNSRLMLMIGAKDAQLKQWTITDPQGYDTTVAVYNLDASKKIDSGLFNIDYAVDQYRSAQ